MGLSVFSRFALAGGVRVRLASLDEPRWRRAFNLRRALQHHTLAVEGGRALQVYHTHLSAFSRGDGTLEKQVGTLLREVGATVGPAVLAGDLNSLPPGDGPGRLGEAARLYADDGTPIAPLFAHLEPVSPRPGEEPAARAPPRRHDRCLLSKSRPALKPQY